MSWGFNTGPVKWQNNYSFSYKNDDIEGSSNQVIKENDIIIAQQKIRTYIDLKKELYDSLTTFLENEENDENDFNELINIIFIQKEEQYREKIENFLYLLTSIADNHHLEDYYFKNIFDILKYYQDQIKQTFSNMEIFNIFKNNKILLLFLLENKIITVDENIYISLANISEPNGWRYCHFFYPEVKEYLGDQRSQNIKEDLLSKNHYILDNFNEKRHEGQNDSYICTLIRNDSVEEFISYVNRANIPLNSKIKPSLFETNSFLLKNEPTLIEYSCFFGSIQIFQYLRMNDAKLTPSLWLYTIHSRNAELIHLLETYKVEPPNNKYEECFIESIKCHHNEIAEYIKDNLMVENFDNSFNQENAISNILQYHNYAYFPSDFEKGYELFYLCSNHYHTLVNLFMKKKDKYIKTKINQDILIIFFHKITIKEAANTNQIEIIYYLLSKQKEICNYCFYWSNKLRQIAIPSSIALIGNNAFNECLELAQITIPSSVTSIGNNVFEGCSSLTQITIPSSVTSIRNNAFNGCSSLIQVTIPSSITSIGDNVFNLCSSLTQITIPSSVTSIGNNAFSGCLKLTQITIPSSVTSIGNNVFNRCSSLTQITIPSSVISIGDNVFNLCSSLTQITIPSSVTSIGDNIFSGCWKLTQITIPSSVTSIGNNVFNRCSSLTQITIPSSVTSIGNNVFEGCSSLTQITIPSSVTSIGNNVFYECSSLTQITIPSSVTSIGNNVFYGCSSLTQITIPSSAISFGNNIFGGIKSLEICGDIIHIPNYFFQNCSSLTQITIPSSVTSIGKNAFSGCSKLTQITIPSSVTSFGDYVFNRCSSLTQITIPSSVTSIGKNAFSGCSKLTQITIPSSITSIGDNVFDGCSSLTQITIPSSVTSIGNNAFNGCSKLTQIIIPSSVTSIGISSFGRCTSLSKISIPSSVKIGFNAFSGCSSLPPNSIPTSQSDTFNCQHSWNDNQSVLSSDSNNSNYISALIHSELNNNNRNNSLHLQDGQKVSGWGSNNSNGNSSAWGSQNNNSNSSPWE